MHLALERLEAPENGEVWDGESLGDRPGEVGSLDGKKELKNKNK